MNGRSIAEQSRQKGMKMKAKERMNRKKRKIIVIV